MVPVSGEATLKLAKNSEQSARASRMALQPMSRPDPPDPPEHSEEDEPLFALNDWQHSDVTSLASKLAPHTGSANSHELALDLVLNEIVEQARLATMATGAAIALFRGDEMVCRATSGGSAPDLGVRLNTRTGLSGACVRTRMVQRCDDTQTDPRVDGAALRNLEVRSILVVPIVEQNELIGIFEILSPRIFSFGDREVQTLEALSLRIVRSIEKAAGEPEPEPVLPVVRKIEAPQRLQAPPKAPVPTTPSILLPEPPTPPVQDHWTTVLTGLVIGLAILLGWMVGYVGWRKAVEPVAPSAPVRAAERPGAPENLAAKNPVVAENKAKPAPPAKATKDVAPPPGGLVVYQKGKVVFTLPPEPTAASAVKPAGQSDSAPIIPPDVAATYLRYRVEPDYPSVARDSQALGPVVLQVRVGKDGLVQQASVVSGDPLLTDAAIAAVRQWKYEPYSRDGIALDFSTEVTVNFKGQ